MLAPVSVSLGARLRQSCKLEATAINLLCGSRAAKSVASSVPPRNSGVQQLRQNSALGFGPRPVWDIVGASGAIHSPQDARQSRRRFLPGRLHNVVWVCWTGNNPMPAHLRLCLETIRRNSGLPVVVVTPANLTDYVPEPHPVYPFLHLAHRADYLRCYLLHHYGGIYLDVDTICLGSLESLFDLLDTYEAIGYDGSQWGEYIGISVMGPFRPQTEITTGWFNALHAKLQDKLALVNSGSCDRSELFYWQEILRDIFVPVSLMHKERIGVRLLACNPEQAQLWSTQPYHDVLRGAVDGRHLLILNNAIYGEELKHLSADDILSGPAVLSQLFRNLAHQNNDNDMAQLQVDERRRVEEDRRNQAQEQPLTEEELLRQEVLAELERSQMPAVRKDDGQLQKTIEHYTFADALEVATISIELDKDLYDGATAFATEAQVEVTSREDSVIIWLRSVPVSASREALVADWRLHLSPLFHSIEPDATSWKIRKGKVSVRLKKRKPKEWKKILKY